LSAIPNFNIITIRQEKAEERRYIEEITHRKKLIALNSKWDIIRLKRKMLNEKKNEAYDRRLRAETWVNLMLKMLICRKFNNNTRLGILERIQ
jgi:hypothetical protein